MFVPNAHANSLNDKEGTFSVTLSLHFERDENITRQETIRFFVVPSNDPPRIMLPNETFEIYSNEENTIQGIEIHDEDKNDVQELKLSVSHGTINLDRMFGLRLVEKSENIIHLFGTSERLTTALKSLTYMSSQEVIDKLEIFVKDSKEAQVTRTCNIVVSKKPVHPALRVPEIVIRVSDDDVPTAGVKILYDEESDAKLGIRVCCASNGCLHWEGGEGNEMDCCVSAQDSVEMLNEILTNQIRYVRSNETTSYDDEIQVKLEFRDEIFNEMRSDIKSYTVRIPSLSSISSTARLVVPSHLSKVMHEAFEGTLILEEEEEEKIIVEFEDQDDVLELSIEIQGDGFLSLKTIVSGIVILTDTSIQSQKISLKGSKSHLNSALEMLTYSLNQETSSMFVEDILVWTLSQNEHNDVTTSTTITTVRECRTVGLESLSQEQNFVIDTENTSINIGLGTIVRVDDGRPCGNRTILEMVWSSTNQGRLIMEMEMDNCLVTGSGTSKLRLRCSLVENIQDVVGHVKYELEDLLPIRSRLDVVKVKARFRDLRDLSDGDGGDDETIMSLPVLIKGTSRNLSLSSTSPLFTLEDTPISLSRLRLRPVHDVEALLRFSIRVENSTYGVLRYRRDSKIVLSRLVGDGTSEISFEVYTMSFSFDEEKFLLFDNVIEFIPSMHWNGEASIRISVSGGEDSLNLLLGTETVLYVLVKPMNDSPSIMSSCLAIVDRVHESEVFPIANLRVEDPEVDDIIRLNLTSRIVYLDVEEDSNIENIRVNSSWNRREVVLEGTSHDLNVFLESGSISIRHPGMEDEIWMMDDYFAYRTSESERVLQDELTIVVTDDSSQEMSTSCALSVIWMHRAPLVKAKEETIEIEDVSDSNVAYRIDLFVDSTLRLSGAEDLLDATYRKEINVWGLTKSSNETSLSYVVSSLNVNDSLQKVQIKCDDDNISSGVLYYFIEKRARSSLRAIHTIEGNVTLMISESDGVIGSGIVVDTSTLHDAVEVSTNSIQITTCEDSELDLSRVFRVYSTQNIVNVTLNRSRSASNLSFD